MITERVEKRISVGVSDSFLRFSVLAGTDGMKEFGTETVEE